MALTVTKSFGPVSIGDRYLSVHTVDFDSSYPTGGESLTPADLGYPSTVTSDEFHVFPFPRAGYIPVYDESGHKLVLYRQKDPGSAGGADIPLVEMTNTGDATAVAGLTVASICKRI